jgi:hypothetical protein
MLSEMHKCVQIADEKHMPVPNLAKSLIALLASSEADSGGRPLTSSD